MSDRAELQRMARLIEMNRQRLGQVEQQLSQLDSVSKEHSETEESLKALISSSDSMIPLGAGVHLPIANQKKVVVDLGSNVFAERTLESAAEIMSRRQDDLQSVINELTEQYISTEQKVKELTSSLEKVVENTTTPEAVEPSEPTKSTPSRRPRRGFGGELTMDD